MDLSVSSSSWGLGRAAVCDYGTPWTFLLPFFSATGLRGLCLILDNAPAHKCVLVQNFLKEEKVVQVSHPLYSPDFSPCNFFLFPLLKKTLSGRRYESRNALGSAIYQCLPGIPEKAYFSAFTEWISRLEKCVSVKGEYFEGLK